MRDVGPARLNHLGVGFDYHPVRGSLVALASSSAIVISYSRSINEIPSCKVIHCEQVHLQRSLLVRSLQGFEVMNSYYNSSTKLYLKNLARFKSKEV